MRRVLCVLIGIACCLTFAASGFAGEGNFSDYMGDIGIKFGRGLQNVITSPLEIPCTTGAELKQNPDWGFFSGLGKGVAFMARRLLVGVTEVGTFVIPMEATIPSVCRGQ